MILLVTLGLQTMRRLLLCVFVLGFSCKAEKGGRPFPWADIPPHGDASEMDAPPPGPLPTCSIQKPQPNRILTGQVEVRVSVSDPEGVSISRVVFAFLVSGQPPQKVGEVINVPQDGNIVTTIDSTKVSDGKKAFFCQVETTDGRKGSSQVPVHVDNNPPKVELYPPSTPPFSNFLSDLVIRISVSDGDGVGTNRVVIKVNGNAVADLVRPATGLQQPVTVPTHELVIGKNNVEITANDLAGNSMKQPLSYWVNFVPPPAFEVGEEWSLPSDITVSNIIPISLAGGTYGVIAYGSTGAYLLGAASGKQLRTLATLRKGPTSVAKVADLNGDGLDDVLLVFAEAGENYVLQYFPQVSATFPTATWKGSIDGKVNDVTFGDLNQDGTPDIVAVLEKSTDSLAVALSGASGKPATWSAFNYYGGVDKPSFVVVADFTDDTIPDIVVAKRSPGVLTLYPVSGAMPLVGKNTELKMPSSSGTGTPFNALSAMVLLASAENGNSLLVLDSSLNVFAILVHDSSAPGLLSMAQIFSTGLGPTTVRVADLDADGLDDLAVFCPGSRMVHLFFGDGKGGFEQGAGYLADGKDIALLPLAGKGLDILTLSSSGRTVSVLHADPARPRAFLGPTMVRLEFRPKAIVVGRYLKPLAEMPKHKDLAVLDSEEGGKTAQIHFFATSASTALPTQPAGFVDSYVKGATDLISADLDKNGYDDLLVPSQATSSPTKPTPTMGRLLLQAGLSHVTPSLKSGTDPVTGLELRLGMWAGDSPTLAVVGDFKREATKPGVLDLAVIAKFKVSGETQPELLFQPFVGEGDGTFKIQEGVLYPVDSLAGPSSMATARLTGGSNYDVVLTYSNTGEFTIFYNKGLGLFKAGEGETERFAVGANPQKIVIQSLGAPLGSLDDPYPELIFLVSGDVAIVEALGKVGDQVQYAPPNFLGHHGNGARDLVVADMNNDGFADIVVLDQQDSMVSLYLNLAKGRFSDPYRFSVGLAPTRMAVDDLDNDGCLDVVTADSSGKSVTILRNLCSGSTP